MVERSRAAMGVTVTNAMTQACAGCAVRHAGLCSALSSDEIADLTAIARRKHLSPGQSLVLEGDTAREFANITDGVAKLVRGAEDGRSQIVGLLFQSDFIGAAPGTGQAQTEPHSIVAVTELELCLFPRQRFDTLLHRYPTLENKLLQQTLDELQLARDWMVLLGRKTAEERVATFLLHVAQKMRNSGCGPLDTFDLPLGRADIADYIGLTIETVSRQISKLRKAGIIALDGAKSVTYVDYEGLKERAGF
ncbi:MAG: Crp/Fnr family transcriptional regulator [Pseudomonadota bacterium]